jgi:hypothetical protein
MKVANINFHRRQCRRLIKMFNLFLVHPSSYLLIVEPGEDNLAELELYTFVLFRKG